MSLSFDLFWSFRSPYSYLATSRIVEMVQTHDVSVQVRPVYPLAIRDESFFARVDPRWPAYLIRDTTRIAEMLGIPYRWPRPDPVYRDPETGRYPPDRQPHIHRLTRLGVAAARRGHGLAFLDEVSRTIWGGTENWHLGEHLAQATARAGLDLDALDAEVTNQEASLESEIAANQAALDASGHWGVPTCVFEGEPFFGQDRIEQLLWRMKQRGLEAEVVSATTAMHLNGDMTQRLLVNAADLDWVRSPAGGVERKRFHRVGAAESGQVSSLVRYLPGARFPTHPHPEGEEIFVIDGIFSDHRGDWPAGSWLASPEGFEHGPWSDPGCLIFVKLRQYPGARPEVALDSRSSAARWKPGAQIGEVLQLLDLPAFPERITLERWPAGGVLALFAAAGLELFLIHGALKVDGVALQAHGFLRLPAIEPARVEVEGDALVWLKRDGAGLLRSA